jgi:predicted RNase H-like HicB family nuclease
MMEGEEAATGKTAAVQAPETGITYDVVLVESGEGWAVMCPALLGCVSQGDSESEALANIREAITGWLKFEARDVESRTQRWLDEYQEAGFPAKTATVSVT